MPVKMTKQLNRNKSYIIWKIEESICKLEDMMQKLGFNYEKEVKHIKKKKEYICSRVALLKLCELNQIPFNGIIKDNHNKPFLVNTPVHISISHAYPYVGVMLDTKENTGIDVEIPKDKHQSIAPRYLSKQEILLTKNNGLLAAKFWSAKEAVYKYNGRKGLSLRDEIHITKIVSPQEYVVTFGKNNAKMSIVIHFEMFEEAILCYTGNVLDTQL